VARPDGRTRKIRIAAYWDGRTTSKQSASFECNPVNNFGVWSLQDISDSCCQTELSACGLYAY